jgi:hypothetical protein
LKDLSKEELINLQGLELLLTWQEIIKYREWALIELRIEAKRFMQSGIEVKPHNLTFTDIWVKCVDAEEIKMKGTEKNQIYNINEIELSFADKTALYEILASDKDQTLISFMNGEAVELSTKKMDIDIELSALTVIITDLIPDDDQEREKEFSNLNFLNMCRCIVCGQRRSIKYTEESHQEGNLQGESKEEDHRFLSARHIGSIEDPPMVFEQHRADILNDLGSEFEHLRSPRDDNKQSTSKKDVKIQETSSFSESLSIVCFFEFLNLEGSIGILKDGSVITTKQLTLQNILIYDTSMLNQFNIAAFDKEFEMIDADNKGTVYFKLNHEERRSKNREGDPKIKDEYRDSRVLSMEIYEAILRYVFASKSALSYFLDKLSCKRFISFMEHYEKYGHS